MESFKSDFYIIQDKPCEKVQFGGSTSYRIQELIFVFEISRTRRMEIAIIHFQNETFGFLACLVQKETYFTK